MDDTLHDLARAAGVSPHWHDAFGRPQTVPPHALRAILGALGLPAETDALARESLDGLRHTAVPTPPLVTGDVGAPLRVPLPGSGPLRWRITLEDGGLVEGESQGGGLDLPALNVPGYHRLEAGGLDVTLAIAPERCFSIADATGDERARLWGLGVQLYGLKRPGDGGIGDFTALSDFVRHAAGAGASATVLSPVHAAFSADPHHFSPYAPSSRLFLNVLHVDPAGLFGTDAARQAADALALGGILSACESAPLVDWVRAGPARLALLRRLFDTELPARPDLVAAYADFRRAQGQALEDHARFEALHAHIWGSDLHRWNWRTWPGEYRDATSPAVAAFAREHGSEVEFHAFLQWAAARGLASAQAAARAAGMPVGLIGDLAVGCDGGGSQCWSAPDDMLIGLSIGAPPDLLNSLGQAWGLAAFSPRALVASGFRSFIAMLRASMAHVGGVRIDHVMGLLRLWMVPDGADPKDGAYLAYPFEDLIRLVALESQRHRTIVTGEDLGTVPDGFRETLARRQILGMQVLWFEREGPRFKTAGEYLPTAMAVTGTHDLPTVAGWWRGRDIDWRAPLGLLGEGIDEPAARAEREADRHALWSTIGDGTPPPAATEPDAAVDAALGFIGRTTAPLVIIPLEDVLGESEQPNLPGTVDDHPNWRRRQPEATAQLLDRPEVKRRLALLDQARQPLA